MTTEATPPTTTTAATATTQPTPITVGVLALQGSFREHSTALRRLPNVTALEVRTAEELARCDGLVIPGGESTTMALVAERWGLVGPLREYAGSGKPLWGTCAGLIFLANRAVGENWKEKRESEKENKKKKRRDATFTISDRQPSCSFSRPPLRLLDLSLTPFPLFPRSNPTSTHAGMKEGGQALLGGLDALVSRNFFGAQADSFEATLPPPQCLEPFLAAAGSSAAAANGNASSSSDSSSISPGFRAVFIRAPAVLETGPGVEVLAGLELTEEQVEAAARSRATGSGNSNGSGPSSSSSSASDAAAAAAAAASIPRVVAVAVRQGNLLATSFHPELTDDSRWHALFAEGVRESLRSKVGGGGGGAAAAAAAPVASKAEAASAEASKLLLGRKVNLPADLPVLAPGQKY